MVNMFAGTENIKKSTEGFISRPAHFFQPKLTINQPHDQYKQAADAMAERVMRMADMETTQQPFSNRPYLLCNAV